MTVLKILKSLWLKIRPYTSKRCCAVFLFIWDLLIQNPLRFLRNLNTGELWLQKSRKIALFCPFWLFSQTNKTNSTAAHKFKSLLLRQQKTHFCLPTQVRFLFIQAAGLAYHHRAKCGAYHQGRVAPLYLIARQRASPCGLMIYKAYALIYLRECGIME